MTTATVSNRKSAPIAQALLAEFEGELVTTRQFLERVPGDKLNWRPHEKSMTAGQLALHIAQLPEGVLTLSLADEEVAPDVGGPRAQPTTVREVLDALERGADHVRQSLSTADDERMRSTFRIVDSSRSRTLMAVPRAEFLRAIMFNHWYHHRGQLGVYLRLLGAKVPPSYGPSGDESPF